MLLGLLPFCHANDSARAVKAALMIRDGVAALSLTKPATPSDVTKSPPEDQAMILLTPVIENSPRSSPLLSTGGGKQAEDAHLNEALNIDGTTQSTVSSPNRPVTRKRSSSRYRFNQEGTIRTVLSQEYPPVHKEPVSCQIGITRGKVCVGMVGGSTRCEYTLHGVLVNRACSINGLCY